jgi:hypothetical protein
MFKSGNFKPLRVILQYVNDSRWPDSYEAIQKLKQLVYINYSKKLKMKSYPNNNWLDVICDGFIFRILIRLPKELMIMRTKSN